jgi:dihydroflavonol-4-reductase
MGPGDYKPTPSGDLLLKFLRWKMPFGFPYASGGFSIVDVDDVVAGHLHAMERGRVGQRYILGGNNATVLEVLTTLSEITGLRGPGWASRGLRTLLELRAAAHLQIRARLRGRVRLGIES